MKIKHIDIGTTKEVIEFALFPVKINDITYWFEHYKAVKRYNGLFWETIKNQPLDA